MILVDKLAEKNIKLNIKNLKEDKVSVFKYPRTSIDQSPVERLNNPVENLVYVSMGRGRILIPGTPEYTQNDGLKTSALATCTGFALYMPDAEEALLAIAHLMPSQTVHSLMEQFREQLGAVGISFADFRLRPGYVQLIAGQTTYDRGKGYLRDRISRNGDQLKEVFPGCKGFPFQKVSYSVLSGHLSSSMRLYKDGSLAIVGEGKAY